MSKSEVALELGFAEVDVLHELLSDRIEEWQLAVRIHDQFTGQNPVLGFSVKSYIGSSPTLVNASKENTHFRYKLLKRLSSEEVTRINGISTSSKIKDRTREVLDKSGLKFDGVVADTYRNNLKLVDGDLPEILAHSLVIHYSGEASKTSEVCDCLIEKNPMNYPLSEGGQPFYSYKFKKFFLESALGMMPATIWHGIYDVCGGYIVVQKDGGLVSYHLIRKNLFEEYLYKFTKFETPSSGRHKFAEIYEDGGEQFFNLNLNIRFI